MKLRIKGDSIRLRLLRSEVAELTATGSVSGQIRFNVHEPDILKYSVAISGKVEKMTGLFPGNEIFILLPVEMAREWAQNDETSLASTQPIGETGDVLTILIEKDFVCIGRPDDPDRDDAYPHPEAC